MKWSVRCVHVIFASSLSVLLASPVTNPSLDEDNCSGEEFKCDGFCVPYHWKCDGIPDCKEGADEKDCEAGHSLTTSASTTKLTTPTWRRATTSPKSTTHFRTTTQNTRRVCSSTQYQCSDATCIPHGWRCDGDEDCLTGDDEKNCSNDYSSTTSASKTKTTTKSWQRVTSSTTSWPRLTTDFRTTTQNNRKVCSSTQYQCSDATCISLGWRCDGDEDCLTGDDERNCSNDDSSTTSAPTTMPTTTTWPREISSSKDSTTSMADDQTTTENSEDVLLATTCSPSESFICPSGNCIPLSWQCDMDEDCSGGEDEQNCQFVPCPNGKFRCSSDRRCILTSWLCDGSDDCRDGQDEENCPDSTCPPDYFQCNNNECIRHSWVCDKDVDCKEGEDEKNCPEPTCESNEFQCNDRKCIYLSWVCDGDPDCLGGEDERNCTNSTEDSAEWSFTTRSSILQNSTITSTESDFTTLSPTTQDLTENSNSTTFTESTSTRSPSDSTENSTTFTESTSTRSPSVSDPSERPKDFERFGKIKIWVNVFPHTWQGARESCHKQNSTLLRFTNVSQSAISGFLERKVGKNAWMYWVEKPDEGPSWYQPVAKRIPIPLWFLNGREVEDAPVVSSSDECYFLDANRVIMKALTCTDFAGFICESSP